MKMVPCKECGQDVSRLAVSCPKCGAVLKSKWKFYGCLGCTGLLVLGLIGFCIVGAITSTIGLGVRAVEQATREELIGTFKQRDVVRVGNLVYTVEESWWSNRLGNRLDRRSTPDSRFLFVYMTVSNQDKESRTIPPLQLLDGQGRTHDDDDRGYEFSDSIGLLQTINPGVTKRGFLVFDVPRGQQFKLVVTSHVLSNRQAHIELSPE